MQNGELKKLIETYVNSELENKNEINEAISPSQLMSIFLLISTLMAVGVPIIGMKSTIRNKLGSLYGLNISDKMYNNQLNRKHLEYLKGIYSKYGLDSNYKTFENTVKKFQRKKISKFELQNSAKELLRSIKMKNKKLSVEEAKSISTNLIEFLKKIT